MNTRKIHKNLSRIIREEIQRYITENDFQIDQAFLRAKPVNEADDDITKAEEEAAEARKKAAEAEKDASEAEEKTAKERLAKALNTQKSLR